MSAAFDKSEYMSRAILSIIGAAIFGMLAGAAVGNAGKKHDFSATLMEKMGDGGLYLVERRPADGVWEVTTCDRAKINWKTVRLSCSTVSTR